MSAPAPTGGGPSDTEPRPPNPPAPWRPCTRCGRAAIDLSGLCDWCLERPVKRQPEPPGAES